MKRIKLLTIVAAVTAVAMIQTAQASISGNLLGGGSITIGDKIFSNFGFVATGGGAVETDLAAQANSLSISASILGGVYYLDWSGVIAVNNLLGVNPLVGDLKLSYTVTANPGFIAMIDQQYTHNALPNVAGNQIIISETVANGIGNVGNSLLTLNPLDLSDPGVEFGDNIYINPAESQLFVVKDILISAAAGQIVGLSDVAQSFHQVPEPTTMIAGALLLLPFGASTLRFFRKNRTA